MFRNVIFALSVVVCVDMIKLLNYERLLVKGFGGLCFSAVEVLSTES